MTNLPATLSTLTKEISALTERLAAVEFTDVALAIDVLKRSGMMVPAGVPSQNLIPAYLEAMSSVSKVGLSAATAKLKTGEYQRKDHGFIPPPAELAAMARAEARVTREDLARKRETLQTLSHREPEIDRSPEVMARIEAMRLKAVTALRTPEKEAPEPMSAERAEYLAAIMELRDAPDITAEQANYQRKVAADLEAVRPIEGESDAA